MEHCWSAGTLRQPSPDRPYIFPRRAMRTTDTSIGVYNVVDNIPPDPQFIQSKRHTFFSFFEAGILVSHFKQEK